MVNLMFHAYFTKTFLIQKNFKVSPSDHVICGLIEDRSRETCIKIKIKNDHSLSKEPEAGDLRVPCKYSCSPQRLLSSMVQTLNFMWKLLRRKRSLVGLAKEKPSEGNFGLEAGRFLGRLVWWSPKNQGLLPNSPFAFLHQPP